MKNFDTLPLPFQPLAGKVDYVQKKKPDEWSSSCPNCGESGHDSKAGYPDRFTMWTNANKGKNKVMGWCRKCSYTWFPDGESNKFTPEEMEAWRKEQYEIEKKKRDEAQRVMDLLESERLWEHYFIALLDNDSMMDWLYDSRGLTGFDIGYWQLGLLRDYKVNDEYHSPAISIPVWGHDGEVKNIKLRILNPRSHKDRYRGRYKLGDNNVFVAKYDASFPDVILVEGEFKAMTVAKHAEGVQVISIPSVTPSDEALAEFDKYDKVYVCLDPDARVKPSPEASSPLARVVNKLGRERCAIIDLPDKVDDLINKYGLTSEWMKSVLQYARSVK